jgi:transitional endoplasmic reticulum ATPase
VALAAAPGADSSVWDRIGGLEAVKLQLQQSVLWPLRYSEAFRRLGVVPQKGILLYGPPGCAKTTLVRALAASSGAAFVPLSSADVYSPFVGEAEAVIRRVFHRARSVSPTIVFLDEVEALVGARDLAGSGRGAGRGGGGDEVQTRILATLLTEMDGVQPTAGLLVVGATNRPDLVDAALLRCVSASERMGVRVR